MNVLYEDNHLLVVEKPVNIPVQADASGDDDLLTLCKCYIKETCHKPGEVYLALIHRLDRPVGGVMVFARTSKAAQRLSAQFRGREAKKRYVAIADGDPAPQAELTDWLKKDEATFSSAVVPEGTEGAKLAKLRYSTIAKKDGMALLDVELFTGRAHQIRVQLKNAGLPIHGDQRYHPNATVGTQIALWAYALTISHPTLAEPMTFFSVPQGGTWQAFSQQLAFLPAFSVCRGVYADDDILVVDKNAGVEVEEGLKSELSSIFGEVYPVHRLDANTLGLVVLARNQSTKARLEKAFAAHETEKIYHALVVGTPKKADALVDYGVKDSDDALMRIVPQKTRGAVKMELSYRTLATQDGISLVEIVLHTGKTHQIRVQMANAGYPVLGDDKYGDRERNREKHCRTQQLVAKRLTVLGKTFESLRELKL